ncbi:unnamed protein product, partial [Phaeothamnion confervicola]
NSAPAAPAPTPPSSTEASSIRRLSQRQKSVLMRRSAKLHHGKKLLSQTQLQLVMGVQTAVPPWESNSEGSDDVDSTGRSSDGDGGGNGSGARGAGSGSGGSRNGEG